MSRVIGELGDGGIRIAAKMDNAPELVYLRRDVRSRESKVNGAVETAVRRRQWQFRTVKSHVEVELKAELPRDIPCCSAWQSGLLGS